MNRVMIKLTGLAILLVLYYLIVSLLGLELNIFKWNWIQIIVYLIGAILLVINTFRLWRHK